MRFRIPERFKITVAYGDVVTYGADPTGKKDSSKAIKKAMEAVSGKKMWYDYPPFKWFVRRVVYFTSGVYKSKKGL